MSAISAPNFANEGTLCLLFATARGPRFARCARSFCASLLHALVALASLGALAHAALHRDVHVRGGRRLVTGVDVPDDTHAGVVGEDPFDLLPGQRGAVGHADLTGVDRPADAHAATVVNGHP